jgi:hypothetical protein
MLLYIFIGIIGAFVFCMALFFGHLEEKQRRKAAL